METKKNPKADVRRNSAIYFAVGLALMLSIANYSINYKTYDRGAIAMAQLDMGLLEDDIIPITKHPETPPPVIPPAAAPEVFEVIENEADIDETLVQSTETDEDDKILDIDDVVVDEIEEDVVVPYAFIQHVPIFPGCEKGDNDAKKSCMSKKIKKFVQKKFNVDLAEDLGLSGRQRISVIFKIDKNGDVMGVQSRAPHPRLEKEAARVINMLPKMKPGKQRGEPVTVSYSLPIVFQVQN